MMMSRQQMLSMTYDSTLDEWPTLDYNIGAPYKIRRTSHTQPPGGYGMQGKGVQRHHEQGT